MTAPQPVELGRRIVVWGATGSGKTTVTRQLASRLDLPRIELDAIFWEPGWVETPDEEFRVKVQSALDAAAEGWVLDGSYSRVSDLYLARADTLLWIRLPWRVSFWRLLRRTVTRAWTRETLYYENGPYESWRQSVLSRRSILWWSISHHRDGVRRVRARLAEIDGAVPVYELRSAREVREFMQGMKKGASQDAPSSLDQLP